LAVELEVDIRFTRCFWRPSNLKQAKPKAATAAQLHPGLASAGLRQGRIPEAEMNIHDRSTSEISWALDHTNGDRSLDQKLSRWMFIQRQAGSKRSKIRFTLQGRIKAAKGKNPRSVVESELRPDL